MKVAIGVVGGVATLWLAAIAISFVPGFVSNAPHLISAPAHSKKVGIDDPNDAQKMDRIAKTGCRHIPVWLRPISARPKATRLDVYDASGHQKLSSFVVRCSDLKVLRVRNHVGPS